MFARVSTLLAVILTADIPGAVCAAEAAYEQVSFRTADGIVLYGDRYRPSEARATVLLFHQGGSNARAEYGPIIPQLLELGFGVLAIDQRVGGQLYGQYNRTVAEDPRESSYCAAAPDLEAAVDWVRIDQPAGRVILWGSSYSAALAIRLAASRPNDIAGVLAFSPASGGPMADCLGDPFFADLRTPLLIVRPAKEAQIESVAVQLEQARESGHEIYIAESGTHGSSMLVEGRVGRDVTRNWERVEEFLELLVRQ